MKNSKKLVSAFLALAMAAVAVPAMAEGNITGDGTTNQTSTLTMTYNVTQYIEVTIPTTSVSVSAGATDTVIGNVTVNKALIDNGKVLKISVNGANKASSTDAAGFALKLNNATEYLNYTLKCDDDNITPETAFITVASKADSLPTKSLKYTLSDTAEVSGTYEDTLTFTVAVN